MPEVILPGAAGRIEARYSPGKTPTAPIALILHPHPKAGGHMNNPVAVQMYHLFMTRGFATLRFNFRGVGRSQGEFDSGIGELADAATALDWLQAQNPQSSQTWVAGYQFGAFIGMQLLMRRPETDGFISVSAPANMYDFSFLAPCPASGLFLHGSADTIVPPAEVERVVAKLRAQKGIVIDYDLIEGASHFWENNMADVEGRVARYLDMRMAASAAAEQAES
ncbi:MAG: alpha/beta hydrolase [Caulobacterales bacterium]|nr:alpha/beta hydrolase [Caulobacterales bacterium]